MKLVRFHGHLKDLYPEGIRVEGDSAAECIAGLQLHPGFRHDDGVIHQVFLPDFQSRDAIYDKTSREIIEMHPVLEGGGGKNGSIIQIIIGVVLIATGYGAPAGAGMLGMSGGTMMMAGALMVLGGVTALLMPQPKLDTKGTENNRSNYLSANKNTVKIGTRIPLIFGKRRWYGHYLSFNVSAFDRDVGPAPQPRSGGTYGQVAAQVVDYNIENFNYGAIP